MSAGFPSFVPSFPALKIKKSSGTCLFFVVIEHGMHARTHARCAIKHQHGTNRNMS